MENCVITDNNPCAPIQSHSDIVKIQPSAHLPPRHTGARNNHRSVAQKPGNRPHHGKNSRAFDRSKSNRRRFYSNEGSQRRRESHQRIIQQPHGWYQVDQIGRNQSLEPRLPTCEPVITSSNFKRNKKRRNRRHSQKPNDSQSTYVPTNFKSTVSVMRELPFARLHYNSFRRLFPNLPTRLMKDKKFRMDAAQMLPFFKCTDKQLLCMLNGAIPTDLIKVSNDPSVCSFEKHSELDNESIAWLPEPTTQTLGETECSSETDDEEEEKDTNGATTLYELTEASLYENKDGVASPKTSTQFDQDISDSTSHDEVSTQSGGDASKASQPTVQDKEFVLDSLPYINVDGDVSAIFDRKASKSMDSQITINQLSLKKLSVSKDSPENVESDEIGVISQLPDRTYASTSATVRKEFPRSRICYRCSEIAYPAERVETDDKVFHISCFRCRHCSSMLQRGGWNQRGLNYYCNPCHRRLALQTLRH